MSNRKSWYDEDMDGRPILYNNSKEKYANNAQLKNDDYSYTCVDIIERVENECEATVSMTSKYEPYRPTPEAYKKVCWGLYTGWLAGGCNFDVNAFKLLGPYIAKKAPDHDCWMFLLKIRDSVMATLSSETI